MYVKKRNLLLLPLTEKDINTLSSFQYFLLFEAGFSKNLLSTSHSPVVLEPLPAYPFPRNYRNSISLSANQFYNFFQPNILWITTPNILMIRNHDFQTNQKSTDNGRETRINAIKEEQKKSQKKYNGWIAQQIQTTSVPLLSIAILSS